MQLYNGKVLEMQSIWDLKGTLRRFAHNKACYPSENCHYFCQMNPSGYGDEIVRKNTLSEDDFAPKKHFLNYIFR